MVLGYYKYRIKYFFSNALVNFKLRRKNKIGRGVQIEKSTIIDGPVIIRDHVKLSNDVILGKNVLVGSNARLSRIKIGQNSHIETGVICTGNGNGKIQIGRECYIGINNILDWSDDITIGDYVQIAGASTGLWTHSSANQAISGTPLSDKEIEFRPTAPIVIENNVYIGGNCTIYPGVTIKAHSIVAPNSAVTKDVPAHSMFGGVPARFIKTIK